MEHTAFITHNINGRLRLRVPSKKGDAHFFESVRSRLATLEGVASVEINPQTTSVLVMHSTSTTGIVEHLKGLLRLNDPLQAGKANANVSELISELVKKANDGTKEITGKGLDIPRVAFLSLLSFGLYQLNRGNFVVPPWYTAFWYAHGIFTKYLSK
ncbi:MAG: hypothetical protein HQK89_09285 [Nitrospirae bacterium]|nr:hypothetical protein [Nitrospirota bacterium]